MRVIPMDLRYCKACNVNHPISEFYSQLGGTGYYSMGYVCHKVKNERRRLRHKAKRLGRPKVADYIDGNRRALGYLFTGRYGVDPEFTAWTKGVNRLASSHHT